MSPATSFQRKANDICSDLDINVARLPLNFEIRSRVDRKERSDSCRYFKRESLHPERERRGCVRKERRGDGYVIVS